LGLIIEKHRSEGSKIGFVPTMGALHAGHISLLKEAKVECNVLVCSIFVNPTQFNDPKDLEKYPRPIERDTALLEEAGCDYLFLPSAEEIYPNGTDWTHHFGELEKIWEGAMRPGHFKGVGQVVLALFEIVKPDYAFFGQKDFQQTLIVNKLIEDFKLPIELKVCKIVREANGLAMSSRNVRLSEEERAKAGLIYRVLVQAKELAKSNATAEEIITHCKNSLQEETAFQLEYFAICDPWQLRELSGEMEGREAVALVALRIGNTRLIDNMLL